MMTNLALINLDDLRVILSEGTIKNEVWDSNQASEYLQVSKSVLAREVKAGIVPGAKIGADWKFSSIALYEYVARKKVQL